MHHAGVAAPQIGARVYIPGYPALGSHRCDGATPLERIQGAARLGRDERDPRLIDAEAGETGAGLRALERTRRDGSLHDRNRGPDMRPGAPSSAYLAQHIAQEVAPEAPGFDRYDAGSRAYLARRESTVEYLTATRLDIFI